MEKDSKQTLIQTHTVSPVLRTVFFVVMVVADNKSGISCTSAIIHTNGFIKLYRDMYAVDDLFTYDVKHFYLCTYERAYGIYRWGSKV